MNTAEHNALNALVNRCCALEYEAERIEAELTGLLDMAPSEKDAQHLVGGCADAAEANAYRIARVEEALRIIGQIAAKAQEAAEVCNSGLLF